MFEYILKMYTILHKFQQFSLKNQLSAATAILSHSSYEVNLCRFLDSIPPDNDEQLF